MAKDKSLASKKEKLNLHDDGFDAYKAAAMDKLEAKLEAKEAEDEYDAYHFKDGLEPMVPEDGIDSQAVEKADHLHGWGSDDEFTDDFWGEYDMMPWGVGQGDGQHEPFIPKDDPVDKLLQDAIKLKADADYFSQKDNYLSDFELKKLQEAACQIKQEADALLKNIQLAKSVKSILTPTYTNLLKAKKNVITGMDQKDLEIQMAALQSVQMKEYQQYIWLKMKQEATMKHTATKAAQLEDMKAELHTLVYGGLVFDPLTNMSKPDASGNSYSLTAMKEATEQYKKQHGLSPFLKGTLHDLKAAQPIFDEAAKQAAAFNIDIDHHKKAPMSVHVPGATIAQVQLGGCLFIVYRFPPYTKDGVAYPTVDAMSDWDARVALNLSVSQYADLVQAGALTLKKSIVYEDEVLLEDENLVLVEDVQHLLRLHQEMQLADTKGKKYPALTNPWGPIVGWKNHPYQKG